MFIIEKFKIFMEKTIAGIANHFLSPILSVSHFVTFSIMNEKINPNTNQAAKFCMGTLPSSHAQKPFAKEAKGSSKMSVARISTADTKDTANDPDLGRNIFAIRKELTVTETHANAIAGGVPFMSG